MKKFIFQYLVILIVGIHANLSFAQGQEALIKKNLIDRIPQLGKIEEIKRTPMQGLYEVRVNETEIFYTDSEGNFLLDGSLTDTKIKKNLTEERTDKLLAIDFKALPIKDAITIVRGNGERKLAIFEDPNCSYCKRFERELQGVDNVTIYLFLYPILSADSMDKSKNVWCARDRARAWLDMMTKDTFTASGNCDTAAIQRNLMLGQKNKINGTPTLIFTDGTRVPGAITSSQVEKFFSSAKS
ncbi:MAG: DsbC family protein [Limnohabitans sp.]|nr:DsbC family protein [Limnohabitans sp.]